MMEQRSTHRKRICLVANIPLSMKVFLKAHILRLSRDYHVTLLTNGSAEEMAPLLNDNVSFTPIDIERKISPLKDLSALIRLWRLFRAEKFDCVHSILPKSGLLSMLAAKAAGIPLRFHTFTGQVWATKTGMARFVLKSVDKVMAASATHLLADSDSQRRFLIENGVVKPERIGVLAEGSIAGIDAGRFRRDDRARGEIRSRFNIPDTGIVFMFLGRLTRDKGLRDLIKAFTKISKRNENLHLLVVGPDEDGLEKDLQELSKNFPGRVHRVGFTDSPEKFMSAADVFCLPSYREGFGSVIIEAAAAGLPAIASRIYGVTDAIEEGVTGILHKPAVEGEIAEAMALLASNEALRREMGEAARQRSIEKFSCERVTGAFADFYRENFDREGLNAA